MDWRGLVFRFGWEGTGVARIGWDWKGQVWNFGLGKDCFFILHATFMQNTTGQQLGRMYEERYRFLESLEPGGFISADVLETPAWTGESRKSKTFERRMQEVKAFVERYFAKDRGLKVLCVQRDYGLVIAVGETASVVLAERAAKSVQQIRKINNQMVTHVDRRAMDPRQQARHEARQRYLALQVEQLDRAELRFAQEEKGKNGTYKFQRNSLPAS